MRLETRIGSTLSFERNTRPTIRHRRFMARWISNVLVVFVIVVPLARSHSRPRVSRHRLRRKERRLVMHLRRASSKK